MELASLVSALADADAETVRRAVVAATALSSVAPCRDEQVLASLGLPQAERRAEIREVRADVVRALNVQRTGRYDQALILARTALTRAEAIGWLPLVAAARYREGALLSLSGAPAEAELVLEDAHFEALRAADSRIIIDTSLGLLHVVGAKLARPADGRRWGRFAEAAIEASDGSDRTRADAIALAERAREAHREAGRAEELAEIDRWLAEHRNAAR